MHREVIPLLAYILASCPGIHDRIDRIYQSYRVDDEETEKHRILKALQQTGNNKTKAATLLGIDRKTLYNKLKLYHIPQ